MKVLAGVGALIAFSILCTSHLFALENEQYGKAGGQRLSINYKQDEKVIHIYRGGKDFIIPLSGYEAKELNIKDIDFDGNDEILFLDLTGVSTGGELRLFYWVNESPTEIDEEYFANKITLRHLDRRVYILLWQHDTEDLFYCNEVLFFKNGVLLEEISQKVWSEIITSYKKIAASEKSNWRKSRYYSYLAMAYQKIGSRTQAAQYLKKAKTLDPQNPFTE